MELIVKKWGNSMALRIPSSFLKEVGVNEGSILDITLVNGTLVLTPKKKVYDLKTLLEGINESNLHPEILTGDSMGEVIW